MRTSAPTASQAIIKPLKWRVITIVKIKLLDEFVTESSSKFRYCPSVPYLQLYAAILKSYDAQESNNRYTSCAPVS